MSKREARSSTRTGRWRMLLVAGVLAAGLGLVQLVHAEDPDGSDVAAKLGSFDTTVGLLSGAVSNATQGGDEFADEPNAGSIPFLGGKPGSLLGNVFEELGPLSGFDGFAPADDAKVRVIDDKVNTLDGAIAGDNSFPTRTYTCGAAACNLDTNTVQQVTSIDLQFQVGGSASGDIDFDSLGLPSIGFAMPNGDNTKLHVDFSWSITARLVADTNGLHLAPSADPNSPHELTLGATISLQNTSFLVNLGALKVRATEEKAPRFSGTLQVDVADNGDLSFGFRDGALFEARWGLKTEQSPLMGVEGDLDIKWTLGASGVSASGLVIKVDDILIHTEEFVGKDLKEAASRIRDVTHPIRTAVSPLVEPLPGLSDISAVLGGDDVTMLRLMETANSADPSLRDRITKLQLLDDAVGALAGDDQPVSLGSFTLVGDDALKPVNQKLADAAVAQLKTIYNECGPCKTSVDAFLKAANGGTMPEENQGFQVDMPVLRKPESLAGLLLGRDVDLITFDTGPVGYGPEDVNVPVARFLIFSVDISGKIEARIRVAGGVDTRGIFDALRGGSVADVVNGLYLKNAPGDAPVVRLSSDVELDLATGIEFVEVELGGGPKVDVTMKVPPNLPDGKLRPALEKKGIGCALLGDNANADFFVSVTATFDYLIDDYTEELVKHTLLDKNDLCATEDESIKVAENDGNGNLTITTATQRKVDPATEPDTVTVYMTHKADGTPDRIFITVNNNRDDDFDAAGIENIRYDSSDDDRPVIFRVLKNDDKPFELNVIIATGDGDDDVSIDNDAVVQVTTNGGADNIIVTAPIKQDDSGDDETLTLVSAGPGDDYIAGSDEGDILGGGAGNDVIYGGGGIDRLNGGADTDTLLDSSPEGNCLIGGPGNDQLIGGPGADQLFGDDTIFCSGTFDPKDSGVSGDGTDVITTGGGADVVIAGGADDEVRLTPTDNFAAISDRLAASWRQGVTVHGNGGVDVITTGNGADWIHGGPGDDKIYADRGPVDPARFLNAGADRIFGGLGADWIEADGDSDVVWGDNGVDACAPPIDGQPAEADDAGGDDDVYGGGGNDQIALEAGDDYAEGQAGDDTICGHKGVDSVHAGDDEDTVYGGTGNDYVYGDADADLLFGNADSDLVDGGTGDDWLVGGSSKAGTKDAGDQLSGNEGADVLIGDNGLRTAETLPRPSVFDLFAGDPTLGGADTINGGDGTDRAFGGLAGDTIHGEAADDHLEGNLGDDSIYGDGGDDDLIGGTSPEALPGALIGQQAADASDVGETLISGGNGRDVIVGDNGVITRPGGTDPILGGPARAVTLLDRDRTGAALAAVSGGDYVEGNRDSDRIYGQGGADYLKGNEADDFVEGNQDGDRLEGNDGEDDLIGGSSFTQSAGVGDPDGADRIAGGAGADVLLGDNAAITRATTNGGSGFDWDSVFDRWLGQAARRSITLLDKATLDTTKFGADVLSGGAGPDVLFGQDGADSLYGGSDDDYQEGNGGSDVLYGDQVAPATGDAHESGQPALDGTPGADGQDDQLGGSSWAKSTSGGAVSGQRDGHDELHGDGNADVQLGDNGRIRRVIVAGAYQTFQATTGKPTFVRQASSGTTASTALPARFDVGALATAGVWGHDTLYGDAGDDLQLGQDGDDYLYGGTGDDDMYGELGNDRMFGEAGEDAMLGDRGVITDRLVTTPGATFSVTSPPAIAFTPYAAHPLDRRVNQNADGDGNPLQAPGMTTGGNDVMRGGPDHDSLHGGAGNDLMNGDSGGDYLFGGNGVDVMWGGKGRECANPTDLACLNDRGTNDAFVDYLFGGFGLKTDPVTGGADVLDFRPRPGMDPASWFEATSTGTNDPVADHQHHQGIDWIYGGWDRDVMQANVADNGPNAGDRLIDWTGAYNLYVHCPAAYGGYNDIRVLSPALQSFLEQLAFALGAGDSLADVRTKGTSGSNELALVYQADVKSNSGTAYPTTPGHFETFSCEP